MPTMMKCFTEEELIELSRAINGATVWRVTITDDIRKADVSNEQIKKHMNWYNESIKIINDLLGIETLTPFEMADSKLKK